MTIVLTAVAPTEVAADGGYLLRIIGDFSAVLGESFNVHVGSAGDSSDTKCVSGIPGRGTVVTPLSSTELRAYTPRLDVGVQNIFIQNVAETNTGLLPSALTVFPKGFETSVYGMRKVLPPNWVKGPLTIDQEDPV